MRLTNSSCLSQQRTTCVVRGSQSRGSMVSVNWFEGLNIGSPWSRLRGFRVSILGVPKAVPKGGHGRPTFKQCDWAVAIARKRLLPAKNVLRGDGVAWGVEPPPSEVSTIVIEAHAIDDAQPRRAGLPIKFQIGFLSRHGRRRRRRLLTANDHGAKRC